MLPATSGGRSVRPIAAVGSGDVQLIPAIHPARQLRSIATQSSQVVAQEVKTAGALLLRQQSCLACLETLLGLS